MPHFAGMLASEYRARGYDVEIRTPRPRLFSFVRGGLAKWAGYVDQYVFFPRDVRATRRHDTADTLYVFCDQAMGPWVPLVSDRPHVVHCHDLLALCSALGDIPENHTSPTGRVYQRFIRRGFRRGRHFISVSEKSRSDLHYFGGVQPVTSEVVYNGLNLPYAPMAAAEAQSVLRTAGLPVEERGMLLHVGGGQWYKNRAGLIHLYAQYADRQRDPLALWMVSPPPDDGMREALASVPAQGRVLFFRGLDNRACRRPTRARALSFSQAWPKGLGGPLSRRRLVVVRSLPRTSRL